MNEQLQKEILEIIKSSKGFVVSQMPEAVQEYLKMVFLDNCFGIVVSCLVLILFCCFIFNCYYSTSSAIHELGGALSWVGFFICLIFLTFSASNAIKVKFYPKGFLIEKIMPKDLN